MLVIRRGGPVVLLFSHSVSEASTSVERVFFNLGGLLGISLITRGPVLLVWRLSQSSEGPSYMAIPGMG